jgi:rubrerythrin
MVSEFTLGKILARAIQKEIESQTLYSTLSNRVKNKYASAALRDLAKYEKEHQLMLERYRRGELKEGALSSSHVVDYKIAEHLEQPEISSKMSLKEVFLLAANREKASHALYLGLAEIHPQGEVRRMFERLAAQELEHKQKMEYLYTEVAFPQTDGG